jgi:branched-subunit amino acid transport protein AzlD
MLLFYITIIIIIIIIINVWTCRSMPFFCKLGWTFLRNFGRPVDAKEP